MTFSSPAVMKESLYLETVNIIPKLFLKWQLKGQSFFFQRGHQKKHFWKNNI